MAVVALLVAAQLASAATLTIAPTADTYFETYGSETRNFGAEPLLRLDQWGGRQVMLRFPLDSIPRERRVTRAALRLFITDVGFNDYGEFADLKTCVGLFDLATPWTEAGVTFNTCDGTKPWGQGPGIPGGKYGDVGPLPVPDIGVRLSRPTIPLDPARAGKGMWLELDVADYLRERLRAGDREANLLLKSSVLGRNFTFRSREAPEEAERPQLAVETSDALPDFRLAGAFRTDWRPGQAVTVQLNGQPGTAKWSFAHKPGASKLTDAALQPAANGAAFAPDVPGLYRVRCESTAEATGESADVYALTVPSHPRLYINPTRLASLRGQMQTGARLPAAFRRRVDSGNGGLEKGQYHDFGPPEGCEDNALMYLLTGDAAYARNSIAYAQLILARPMREHFHDVHEATFTGAGWVHAMMVHYDWCYDQLTAEQRGAVADWLKEAATWGAVRSGRPIAHNDGGARQIILSGAGLALLGDDPAAPEYLRAAHANFDDNLLPWLNDGGRGGRSGDGGEYEGLHGFFIVRYAWLARSGTGEDVFSDSPYFANRIRHILFGWYPRRLFERHGQYSIRTYYSPSGDHIRFGYVGDTQPYQSAAALCDRYRDQPEAQALRRLAGEWPTQWMQYCLKWAVLGDFDSVPQREPADLSYLDEGCQTLYARSDWSDDATWVLFEGGPYVSVHQSLDKGGFEIFKGDLLAARTGNLDHGNVGARHPMGYLHRTISTNGLLINDPQEQWKGFLAGATGDSDGGGERTNFPITSAPEIETWQTYRQVIEHGAITRSAQTADLAYALMDLTGAYNSPAFHGDKVNRAKVTDVARQLLYLRGVDSVLVHDRVSSTQPEFKKTFLLHSCGDLEVEGGQATRIDDGEFHYTGATRAVIRYGWPQPVESFARCLAVTLLPENPQLAKIGGRVDLPAGQTEGYPGDQWHGQHRHHHLKDFWVNGVNLPPGNPPETRWFGDPATEWYVPGTPDETGGRGKWRLEVSPPAPALDDRFFHVLCPRLGSDGPFPEVRALTAEGWDGAWVAEAGQAAAVFFARDGKRRSSLSAELPAAGLLVVADLEAGAYVVQGKPVTVAANGLLVSVVSTGTVSVVSRP